MDFIHPTLHSQIEEEKYSFLLLMELLKLTGWVKKLNGKKPHGLQIFGCGSHRLLQAKKQTRFKIIRDEQNLYILVEAKIDGKILPPNLKRDFSTFGVRLFNLTFRYF